MSERLDLSKVLWASAQPGGWNARDGIRVERFVAHPDISQARRLLPWRPGTVVAVGARSSDDRSRRRGVRESLGVAALMTVGALSPKRRLGVTCSSSLVGNIAAELGQGDLHGVVQCGPPRANQKPVLQLHDRFGRTVAWAKVAWNDLTKQLLDTEREVLEQLSALSHKGFESPPVLAHGEFGESTWIALGPVGVDRRRRPSIGHVDVLARAVEGTAERWEGPCSQSPYVARLTSSSSGLAAAEPLVARLSERWGDRSLPCGASHGDFVPWNMLSGSPTSAVWDWERYTTSAPVGTDRFHFRFQVGLHRRGLPLSDIVASISSELDMVVPELEPWQRRAHLEWYVVDLLCRYERDGVDQYREHWRGLTTGLADAATELLKERRP